MVHKSLAHHLTASACSLIIGFIIFIHTQSFLEFIVFKEFVPLFNSSTYLIGTPIIISILTFFALNALAKKKKHPKLFMGFMANLFIILLFTTVPLGYLYMSGPYYMVFLGLLPISIPVLLILGITNWKIYKHSKKLT